MNVLEKDYIFENQTFVAKDEVFAFLAQQCVDLKISDDKQQVIEGLNDRELESSTCFGDEIALPHCRVSSITKAAVLIIKNNYPIRWDNNNNATIIIMLAIPDDESSMHIKVLSSIARKLVREEFVNALKASTDTMTIYELFQE